MTAANGTRATLDISVLHAAGDITPVQNGLMLDGGTIQGTYTRLGVS